MATSKFTTSLNTESYLLRHPTFQLPANAIFSEDEVPKDQEMFTQLNEELAQKWPNITEMKGQMPEAEKWDGVEGKIQYLEK